MPSIFRKSRSRRSQRSSGANSHTASRPKINSRQVLIFSGILVGLLVMGIFGFVCGYAVGGESQKRAERKTTTPQANSLDPAALAFMDEAMQSLRAGDTGAALGQLDLLRASHPEFPSLQYAYALTWLAADQPHRAGEFAKASVALGERVADSLALQAAILKSSTSPGDKHLASPDTLQGDLLLQAIASDPLNPAPRIELAHLLRSVGDRDSARAHLRAAQALLHPVESSIVVETTLAIMDAEDGVAAHEPADPDVHSLVASHFVRAVSAMRSGDPATSQASLAQAIPLCPPATFAYLASDPALSTSR